MKSKVKGQTKQNFYKYNKDTHTHILKKYLQIKYNIWSGFKIIQIWDK